MIIERSRKNNVYTKIYHIWYNIKQRCYNPNHNRYKNYGGKGVRFCERWLVLDNFIEDIDKIEGFDLKRFLNGELCLDKDKKGNSKLYSLETCVFISKEENNKYKPNQQIDIIGTNPKGEKFIFSNQSEFAREHNLDQSAISACIRGRFKQHKGWKFTRK